MKDVKGYEKLYQIDLLGNVWSCRNDIFLKPTVTKQGYKMVCLCKGGKQKNIKVARLMALTYLKKPSSKHNQVNHINSNKADDRLENLEWCTASYNKIHELNKRMPARGVYQRKNTGRWIAKVKKNYKDYWIGSYATKEEALEAYQKFIQSNSFIRKNC